MEVQKFAIDGPLLICPRVFHDERGLFFESYNEHALRELGINEHFVQDNESVSHERVLRGLHYQAPPFAQGKLVHVVFGAVIDILVDIRSKSPTYGQHLMVELNAYKKKILWIPVGFAHGFLSLKPQTVFRYKCTAPYHPASERGIVYSDKDLNIQWPETKPIVSSKDLALPPFSSIDKVF